jgi:uncharacterized membrane protein
MNIVDKPANKNSSPQIVAKERVETVDILRGFIMVIMALDHVREYFGPTPFRPEDVSQTTVSLFFTRWITHICAPIFLLLSGVSAYLYCRKHGSKKTSHFLRTRGVWLMLLEIVVFSFVLQWGYPMILLSIIWAIGWSMLILSICIRLPKKIILIVAVSIIVLHNLLPIVTPNSIVTIISGILHNTPFIFNIGKLPILAAYTVFPWAAVMMLGFAIGPSLVEKAQLRNKRWLYVGSIMMGLFIIIRTINSYGDPFPWNIEDRGIVYTALSFINLNKYPASFLFLLLTLGIGALLWYYFNSQQNRLVELLKVYGRVPFFYFLLHFVIISSVSYLWSKLSFNKPYNLSFMTPADWPAAYEPNLIRVYLSWILVVALLFYPCKWFGKIKTGSKFWWISYL